MDPRPFSLLLLAGLVISSGSTESSGCLCAKPGSLKACLPFCIDLDDSVKIVLHLKYMGSLKTLQKQKSSVAYQQIPCSLQYLVTDYIDLAGVNWKTNVQKWFESFPQAHLRPGDSPLYVCSWDLSHVESHKMPYTVNITGRRNMHLRLSEAKSETILEAVVPSRKIKLEFQSDYQNKE